MTTFVRTSPHAAESRAGLLEQIRVCPRGANQPLVRRLERDVDSNGDTWMAAVVHVIAVIDVVHVYVVGFVPGACPGFRPWINDTEPEAAVLESGVSIHDNDRSAVDAEPVSTAKMRTEAICRNAVTVVAPTLVPIMMFMFPIVRTMVLPNSLDL